MRAVFNTISDIEAALGLSQLERYGEFLRARRKIADFYFKNLPAEWTTRLMKLRKGNIFFRFPLYGGFNFEKVAGQLRTKGILIRRGVDSLLRLKNEKFPQAEKVLQNTVSIPIYPSLSIKECKTITDALNTIGTCR
jgi:dTDP-4-amino-4,6-dideoxygalactose transaminase